DEGLRLSPEAEINIYRVVQEALTNVARHAKAKKVGVTLENDDWSAMVMVEDDGAGFTPQKEGGRLGIVGMRERMSLLGGDLEMESQPGRGCRITARVPLKA
ncbi:MAG: ATPase, partial [Verrucomicrobiaceae bacterium]